MHHASSSLCLRQKKKLRTCSSGSALNEMERTRLLRSKNNDVWQYPTIAHSTEIVYDPTFFQLDAIEEVDDLRRVCNLRSHAQRGSRRSSSIYASYTFLLTAPTPSGAGAYLMLSVARTCALAADARDATGGALEEGFGVGAAIFPRGAARTAPQSEEPGFPFLHADVTFGWLMDELDVVLDPSDDGVGSPIALR